MDISKLHPGQKYTIWGLSEFGFPYTRQITLQSAEISKYAQYREAVKLVFKIKGKRSMSGLWVLPIHDFIVYDGWVTVDANPYKKVTEQNGVTVSETHLSFDGHYLKNARNSITAEPVYMQVSSL
jgi:hypothetical protein